MQNGGDSAKGILSSQYGFKEKDLTVLQKMSEAIMAFNSSGTMSSEKEILMYSVLMKQFSGDFGKDFRNILSEFGDRLGRLDLFTSSPDNLMNKLVDASFIKRNVNGDRTKEENSDKFMWSDEYKGLLKEMRDSGNYPESKPSYGGLKRSDELYATHYQLGKYLEDKNSVLEQIKPYLNEDQYSNAKSQLLDLRQSFDLSKVLPGGNGAYTSEQKVLLETFQVTFQETNKLFSNIASSLESKYTGGVPYNEFSDNLTKATSESIEALSSNAAGAANSAKRLGDSLFVLSSYLDKIIAFKNDPISSLKGSEGNGTTLPNRHSGGLHLSGPQEFLAVLQRGEAVIPRSLVSDLPGNILSKLPKFHSGAIFGDRGSFPSQQSILPTEISDIFRSILDFLRNLTSSLLGGLSSGSGDTSRLEELLTVQTELTTQLVAENKQISRALVLLANSNSNNTESAVMKQLSETLAKLVNITNNNKDNSGSSSGRLDVIVSAGNNTEVKHRISIDDLSDSSIKKLIVSELLNNKDLLTSILFGSPILS